ncbi:MAG: aspartate carbamoyltransferase [Planctomycetes bacterium]|nr:aspartate carbamoyltransferase [Planctomycetota bacterium]
MQTNTEALAELPTAHRVAVLSRDDRLYHLILAQQIDRDLIEQLCRLSEMIRAVAEARQGAQFLRTLLGHKRAMLYFIQPSTRTFLSFAAACQILGMPYNEVRNPSTSSEVKGETEDDTIRVLSQYFDLIIMRHPEEGFAEQMAHMLSRMPRPIPLINGGSGKDQHPTQALLDIYTLFRCMSVAPGVRPQPDFSGNPFDGKTIAFVGDLKRGRTVRSLAYLLSRYEGVKLLFVSHPELQIGADILEYLERRNVDHELLGDLRPIVGRCDAVYMTRLQDEWDTAGESKSIDYSRYTLTADMADQFKPNLVIMHPLPRRHELDKQLDNDPRARYWDQVRNGMWMRAAIIATIFSVDARIIDHYHSYYAR